MEFIRTSRSTQSICHHHLLQARQAMEPALYTRFALWGLSQPDVFYKGGTDGPPSFWTALMFNELNLSPEQVDVIREQVPAARAAKRQLLASLAETSALQEKVALQQQHLNHLMDSMLAVYTPAQLSKYYLWVAKNEWTVSLLQSSDVDHLASQGEAMGDQGSGNQANNTQAAAGQPLAGQSMNLQDNIKTEASVQGNASLSETLPNEAKE
jgi:hypothetical protein